MAALNKNRSRRTKEETAKKPSTLAAKAEPPTGKEALRIVGIGASAGGLEALEQLFTHMPPDSGMAFVIVASRPHPPKLHAGNLAPLHEDAGACRHRRYED